MAAARNLILTLALCLVLAGCLHSAKPVLTQSNWEDIPGATGHWVSADDGQQEVFVKKNPNGSYSSGKTPGAYDLSWSGVSLGGGKYVAQYTMSDGASALVLLRVSPRFLVIYNIKPGAIKTVAAQLQLPLKPDPSVASLAAGADKATLKALYNKLSEDATFDTPWIYERRGGFIEPDGRAANNAAALQRARAAGDARAAMRIWQYRADRGDTDAQQQLAQSYATQLHDETRAIGAGLDAYASGNRKVSLTLANLYRSGAGTAPAANAAPAGPDFEQALAWLARAIADGEQGPAIQRQRDAWAAAACERTPPLPADRLKNCIETMPYFAAQNAAVERRMTDIEDTLIVNEMEQKKVRARQRGNAEPESTSKRQPPGAPVDEAPRKMR